MASLGVHATVYNEARTCFESGRCAIKHVCPFHLEADRKRCYGSSCHNLTGQILVLHYNPVQHSAEAAEGAQHSLPIANITWRASYLDAEQQSPGYTVGDLPPIEARENRYFNTHLGIRHAQLVELRLNGRLLTSIAVPAATLSHTCMRGEACAHLLRVCYGNAHDDQCKEYSRHCNGFRSLAEVRRNACVPDCLTSYYETDAPFGRVRSDRVALLLDLIYHRLMHADGASAENSGSPDQNAGFNARSQFNALLGDQGNDRTYGIPDHRGRARRGDYGGMADSANGTALLVPLQNAFCNVSFCDSVLADAGVAGGDIDTLNAWLVTLTLLSTCLILLVLAVFVRKKP